MRRRAIRSRFVLGSLLLWLGFSTTIGVAWFLATIPRPDRGRNRLTNISVTKGVGLEPWYGQDMRGPGMVLRYFINESSRRPSERIRGDPPERPESWSAVHRPPKRAYRLYEYAFGWPMLSLHCSWHDGLEVLHADWEALHGGIGIEPYPMAWMVTQERTQLETSVDFDYIYTVSLFALPTTPILLGLGASTLFYSAIWGVVFVVIALPGTFVRRMRKRRGRCVACAYSLQGLAGDRCPECGTQRGTRLAYLTGRRLSALAVLGVLVPAATLGGALHLKSRRPGPSPIHFAARDGDIAELNRLIAIGASIEQPCARSEVQFRNVRTTPLMWAASGGQTEACRVLLDAKADVNGGGSFGRAISEAVRQGHTKTVALFIERGAELRQPDESGDSLLDIASNQPSPEMLKLLMATYDARSIALNDQRLASLLLTASRSGSLDCMRLLMARGAPVNGAGADYERGSPLGAAVKYGQFQAVRLLLDAGARTDARGGPLLWEAAEGGWTEIGLLLIKAGADVNAPLPGEIFVGWTPLRRAVIRSDFTLVKALLDAGASPFPKTDERATLVFDINWTDATDELIDLVLGLKLDVNARDVAGNTELHYCVHRRAVRGVRTLLRAGADPGIKNFRGHTCFDLAHPGVAIQYGSMMQWHGSNETSTEIDAMLARARN